MAQGICCKRMEGAQGQAGERVPAVERVGAGAVAIVRHGAMYKNRAGQLKQCSHAPLIGVDKAARACQNIRSYADYHQTYREDYVMKLGLLTVMFGNTPLKDVLEIIRPLELDTVELGTGNYPGGAHAPVDELLKSKPKRDELLALIKGEGLQISALSCHGNCLHPDKDFAKKNIQVQTNTILLAEQLGVKTVIDFSGCPGSGPKDTRPNWVTCAWPPDYLDILNYQWDDVVIPYWRKQAQFAKDHGIQIAFEAHPGFVVYNTETLLRIREACGKNLGANFDPSHFFWQGMEPIECVKALGGKAIFHVHAKDSRVDPRNAQINGVLDNKHYGDVLNRSWVFRTCGYGHSLEWWKDFVSTLRVVGYDGPISIEHEDSLMSNKEGLTKAVQFLKQCMIQEKPTAMTWA